MTIAAAPADVQLDAPGTTYLFPLHGLEAFADDFELCGARIARLSVSTWAHIEKGIIGDFIAQHASRGPLFALFTRSDVTELDEAAQRFADSDAECRHLLMALRLLRGRTLIDPALSARYFVTGVYTSRHSAVYRQAFVNHEFRDAYTLEPDDPGRVARLHALVSRAAAAGWAEAALVLENLNHRFAPHLGAADRYLVLCTALEMIFGRFSEMVAGTSLPARAAAACTLAPAWLGDPFDVAPFLSGPGRDLRNIVAHNADRDVPMPLDEGVERLTTIVRRATAVYLTLRPHHRGGGTAVKWFNTTLAGIVAGEEPARSLAHHAIEEAGMHEAAI
jgi:hypothetical protein